MFFFFANKYDIIFLLIKEEILNFMKDRLYDKITKNKLWFIAAIIFAALVASFPGFLTSTYIGKDLTFHAYRIQEMATNIKQGVWLPAVQSNNILGYGYLVGIFYPNLFLYTFL